MTRVGKEPILLGGVRFCSGSIPNIEFVSGSVLIFFVFKLGSVPFYAVLWRFDGFNVSWVTAQRFDTKLLL